MSSPNKTLNLFTYVHTDRRYLILPNGLKSFYIDAEVVPDLASGSPFTLVPVSFNHGPIIF